MTCRILKLVAISLCLCSTALFASVQCPDSAELNITATLYTQENGLTSNMLIGCAKDSTGYLYFLGLEGKWMRFDGANFRVMSDISRIPFYNYSVLNYASRSYTLQYIGNIIYKADVSKDKTTRKWALTGDSLICIHADDNRKEVTRLPEEIAGSPHIDFYPAGENCWLTTRDKVFRYNLHSKKFQNIPLKSPGETTLAPSEPFIPSPSGGSPYLLSVNALLKLNNAGDAFEKFCTLSLSQRLDNLLYTIIMDNYVFVAESNTVIDEINLSNGTVNKFDLADYSNIKNSSALKIITMIRYRDYLLAGTSNAGLFILNRCTRSMQHFQYEKQNSDAALANSVAWIAVHDENVIWMQTDAGLIKLEVNNQFMKTFLPSSVKPGGVCNNCNNVRAVYSNDNNELLTGSFEGVYTFNLSSGQFSNLLSPADKLPVWKDGAIGAITGDSNGNVFIANWSDDGILLLNKEKKKLINLLPPGDHPELSYSNMRCVFYDSHHVLWAGTNNGFLRITNLDEFEKNNFTGSLIVTNQFPGKDNRISRLSGDCFTITEDTKENIWMGTSNGLYVYNYKTNSVIKYIHVPGDNNSLSDNDVRSVYISKDGGVWIGTSSGGLNHFDASANSFTAFTRENGLPNNSIYTILEDNSGFLWLGTNAGLCRFSKADHSVRNYTPRDGIQNFEFNTNAVCKTADGKFCFGGRTGFNIFHPDSMNITFAPPQVVITKFKIFDKEFPVTGSVLQLSHDKNSFTFDFAALNYYRNNDNQYEYMMESADKDWIKSGNRQYTSYNNLSPGEYTFKVRVANYTGKWNEGVTSMKFIINPAWYNTWWFRFAIALIIAAVVYGLYRYRLHQMLKLHAIRNRIASDLHDEIGSTLSSISLSSTIIQSKLNGNNTEVTKLLQQVSSNTDNMMEALSDIVWAINTRNDRFDNVVNRMRAFAIEILEPSNISVQFNISKDISDVHLDMQQRKNIYLIFKEAVNNIVKYSGCKNVLIDISRQGSKTFVMNIKDDGKGFDTSPLTPLQKRGEYAEEKTLSGNGIRNMKKRAEELGGEMTIDSIHGGGTTLHLKFNI
ncbi:MAG TPA: two-component regulator propeller domain-containing protein [Bacteroidia bacterium]|nr:two-component regulator propeller domain-containing protein [Bacteroidia bacterium]